MVGRLVGWSVGRSGCRSREERGARASDGAPPPLCSCQPRGSRPSRGRGQARRRPSSPTSISPHRRRRQLRSQLLSHVDLHSPRRELPPSPPFLSLPFTASRPLSTELADRPTSLPACLPALVPPFPPASLRLRCSRALHLQGDHDSPPHQAPPDLSVALAGRPLFPPSLSLQSPLTQHCPMLPAPPDVVRRGSLLPSLG